MFYISDLNVLVRLLAQTPSSIKVWDPEELIYPDESWMKFKNRENDNFRVLIVMPSSEPTPVNLREESFQLVLNFSGLNLRNTSLQSTEMKYVTSAIGYMRWLYPKSNKSASFTKFLSATTLRMKAIRVGMKILNALKMDAWFYSKNLEVLSAKNLTLAEHIKEFKFDNYSIYLGSQGVNRTALVQGNSAEHGELFLKIPIGIRSNHCIQRERRALNRVKQFDFDFIKLPEVLESNNSEVLVTKALDHSGASVDHFTELHFKAIQEVVSKSVRFYKLSQSPFWLELQNQVAHIKLSKTDNRLKVAIERLFNQLKQTNEFYTCMAHGDFTPWNMFVSQNELRVIDWELADGQYPMLYDLFHFHFQNGVMVQQLNYPQIERVIQAACQNPIVQQLKEVYELDIRVYFQLYLLKSAVKNVLENVYTKHINVQNTMLRDTLIQALEFNCVDLAVNHRQQFIRDFNNELNKYPHAYLKLLTPEIEDLNPSSDLDIAIKKAGVNPLIAFMESHALVKKFSVNKKSFMAVAEILFKDGAFLSVDLIHQFKRRALVYSNIAELITHSVPNSKGYMIPLPEHDFEYAALFYLLNNAPIPGKYLAHYLQFKTREGKPLLKGFKEKFQLEEFTDYEVTNCDSKVCRKVRSKVLSLAMLSGIEGVKNWGDYCVDYLKGILQNKGMMVTLSGVDGAGKSTVIQLVKSELERTYRKKVVLLRHRPGILPILSSFIHGKEKAEYISSVTIPRQGDNKSLFSSVLRFLYYYADYIFGQFFVYFKYSSRGVVVLYDRYYFDFINDASRSNINLSPIWIEKLYTFIFKPDLNIFLYETPEVILKRKKEMNANQITEITKNYRSFFDKMSARNKDYSFRCIRNRNLDQTLTQVFDLYQKVS